MYFSYSYINKLLFSLLSILVEVKWEREAKGHTSESPNFQNWDSSS